MSLCNYLITTQTKLFDKRKIIFKIDRRTKNKTFKKRLSIFRRYLKSKEFIFLKFILKKAKIDKRLSIKNILKYIFKFDCSNIYFREFYSNLPLQKHYKKLSDKSKFKHDNNIILDSVIMAMIKKGY